MTRDSVAWSLPGCRVEVVVQPVPRALSGEGDEPPPADGQEVVGEQRVEPVGVAAHLGCVEGPPAELKNVVCHSARCPEDSPGPAETGTAPSSRAPRRHPGSPHRFPTTRGFRRSPPQKTHG
jgi:hypothetical protein